MVTMRAARVVIEVQAGIIPGQSQPEYMKQWAIDSVEWEQAYNEAMGDDGDQGQAMKDLLDERYDKALEYCRQLQYLSASGRGVNWVRIDWVWL